MEPLNKHQQEIDYRYLVQDGLEVQFVYDSLLDAAYTKVEDHKNNEKFVAITPEGVSAAESFHHPFFYRNESSLIVPIHPVESENGKGNE